MDNHPYGAVTSGKPSQHFAITITCGNGVVISHKWNNESHRPLPIEVCERIIDWVSFNLGKISSGTDREVQENLSTCSLVCRAWRVRAQVHLFKIITLNYEGLSALARVLRENRAICSNITKMTIRRKSEMKSLSFFAIHYRFPDLVYLDMRELNLAREHQWLHRAPLFRSVQRLKLYRLQTCQLSQLIRFINSFPSLSSLAISLAFNKLEHRGQILPKPIHISSRSLTSLELDLKLGVSGVIDWLLTAKPLLAQLKALVLLALNIKYEDELRSSFSGVGRLLDSCRDSIEDITIRLQGVPMVEEVASLIRLSHFPRLRYLTYGSPRKDCVLSYALRQLGAVASKCELIKLTFDISIDSTEGQLDADVCGALDNLLSGDKFSSLQSVYLHQTIPFLYFPKANKAGLLNVLLDSVWNDGQRLPAHLCELIIDRVYYGSVRSNLKWDWQARKALIACSLVCRKWRDHARTHLSKPIRLAYEELPPFGDTLLEHRCILSGVTGLKVVKKMKTTQISPFVLRHHLPNLHYLNIQKLDLTREHQLFYRAPFFHSVHRLTLYRLQSCPLSQLIRFINSFPTLSSLALSFAFKELKHEGQILPKPSHAGTRFLTSLELDLKPGVSRLIDWFLRLRPFLMQLNTLVLSVSNIEDRSEFSSSFKGVERLLDYCRASLESFKLDLRRVPIVRDVSDLVRLESYPNLKYLTYESYAKDFVLHYATRQLGSITSTCTLTQVTLDIGLDCRYHLDRHLCRRLDDILMRERFKSLQNIILHRAISPQLFPKLNAAGRLRILKKSASIDPPAKVGPRLPLKICNFIIDWVYHEWLESHPRWNLEMRRTLFACSLVCKEWRKYSQTHLSRPIEVSYEELSSLSDSLREDRRISSGVLGLKVAKKIKTIRVSPFLIQHTLPNLHYLNIQRLDLVREHQWLHRSPVFNSVMGLNLYHLQPCQLSQLVRFINSFPYLSTLKLSFYFKKLEHKDQILPRPSQIDIRSLTVLKLHLIPGVSKLIDWFLEARALLTRLRTLILYGRDFGDEAELCSGFKGVEKLLDCCHASIEDFRLYLQKVPMAGSVSDLVGFFHKYQVSYNTGLTVKTQYSRMRFDNVGAIASTCNLTHVTFDISLDDKQQPNQVLWSVLDGLLAGDRFSSLKQVELRRTISPELLPTLHKAGRLRVLGRSFWIDHHSVKENRETPILNRYGNVQESGSSITETTEERQYEGHTFTATDEPASPFQRDVYNPVVYFRGQV